MKPKSKEINLLSQEFVVDKGAMKASRTLGRLASALGIVLVFAILIGGGALFLLNRNINSTRQANESITSQIQSLQNTESKLFLIKDRIQKSQSLLEDRKFYDTLEKYSEIISGLPSVSTVSSVEVDVGRSRISLDVGTSDDLAAILQILNSDKYEKVEVVSLTFNSFKGYELVLDII